MPLVHRDESPTTGLCASARCGPCLRQVCLPLESPRRHRLPQRTAAGAPPGTGVCVCVCANVPARRLPSSAGPAPPRTALLASGWMGSPPDVRTRSLRRLSFPVRWLCARNLVHAVTPCWKLEASSWDDSAEQNELGSWQLKCSP